MTARRRAQATLAQLRQRPARDRCRGFDEPFSAFPSWFLRVECDRCGKVQMVNEKRIIAVDLPIRTVLDKMRHDGCGGLAAKAELRAGIEDVSGSPVRKIVLVE